MSMSALTVMARTSTAELPEYPVFIVIKQWMQRGTVPVGLIRPQPIFMGK
jgi:hypothetical protein